MSAPPTVPLLRTDQERFDVTAQVRIPGVRSDREATLAGRMREPDDTVATWTRNVLDT